jgi:phosphoribosylanthranilate isomerase
MQSIATPRVKICCIKSSEEARMAIRHGAAALGLVSAMPSGPGPIPEDLIREIAAQVPPPIATFLLTCRQDVASIIDQHRRTLVNTLQIVDTLATHDLHHLRHALPGVRLVQVIHVEGPESVDEARAVSPYVDAILLDSGRPRAAVKEFGGTGRVHDWSVSARIREAVTVPIFLAGGLKPDNVKDAIQQIGPFGVDVCTGVRTNGSLDETKLAAFFRAVIVPEFSEGFSTLSMISTSMGILTDSNFNPSCSSSAVRRDGGPGSVVTGSGGIDWGEGGAGGIGAPGGGGMLGTVSRRNFKSTSNTSFRPVLSTMMRPACPRSSFARSAIERA